MMTMGLESFDAQAVRFNQTELLDKMSTFNKQFISKLTPENGIYGVTEVIKANGMMERIGKNEFDHTFKEYFTSDGAILKRREALGGGNVATTYFDDYGTAYLKDVRRCVNNGVQKVSSTLMPDTTIVKNNFTATTDLFGRPVFNKISDLKIRPESEARQSLSKIIRDSAYKEGDHRGHIIADSFGGPASLENVVAQMGEVNQGKIAQVENIVRDLKNQGHKVDLEVNTKYVGSDKRPSSFEYKITVDGENYQLAPDLQKIYNSASDSAIKKAVINLGEKYGLANEVGLKNGLVAAGITCTLSSVENISACLDGKISVEDAVEDIATDTAKAGGIAYGTGFITTQVAQTMSKSGSQLISKVGGSCLPAAVVSFGVESADDILDFVSGKIDTPELAYNLGENAVGVAGSFAGAAKGAAIGSVAGPVGTVAGTLIGGVVGTVIATGAYETAIDIGADGAELLADKAQELANNTIDSVKEVAPEKVEEVREAFNDFLGNTKLPFKV